MADAKPKVVAASESATTRWRYIGHHPQDLDHGTVMGPGDFVDLTNEQRATNFNQRLIDEGLLIPAEKGTGA